MKFLLKAQMRAKFLLAAEVSTYLMDGVHGLQHLLPVVSYEVLVHAPALISLVLWTRKSTWTRKQNQHDTEREKTGYVNLSNQTNAPSRKLTWRFEINAVLSIEGPEHVLSEDFTNENALASSMAFIRKGRGDQSMEDTITLSDLFCLKCMSHRSYTNEPCLNIKVVLKPRSRYKQNMDVSENKCMLNRCQLSQKSKELIACCKMHNCYREGRAHRNGLETGKF